MSKIDLQISKQSATLRGQVEKKLREAISAGLYKPGQRLIERELCETLGVGRTSVREALRQLEAEGLITVVPHRGPVVATMTSAEAEQLYALRALLESYAGQRCAELATDSFKDERDAAVEEFARVAQSGDRASLVVAKEAFYELLLTGSGNVYVSQVLTSLHNRINLLRYTSMTQAGRLQHSIREIRESSAAIRLGDPHRSARA